MLRPAGGGNGTSLHDLARSAQTRPRGEIRGRMMSELESIMETPEQPAAEEGTTFQDGASCWRTYVAGSLLLGAAVLWATLAYQEGRFARAAMGPESSLLSPEDVEEQLHV